MVTLLLILFVLFAFIVLFTPEKKKVQQYIFVTIGFILVIIAGFRGEGVDRDYYNYVELFHQRKFIVVEPSFVITSMLVNSIFGPNPLFLFVIFAFLGITLKFIAIKQLTDLWFLSILIYISNFFILHEMTQIRAGIAVAFLLLSIKPIYDRNFKLFLIYAFLGFSFHYSAILIFPLWFLGKSPHKTFLLLSVPIAYTMYFAGINLIRVIPIAGIQEKIEIYQKLKELGDDESSRLNVFNMVFLAKVLIFYFLIWKYEMIATANKYFPLFMKIYAIALLSYPVLAPIPAIATRTHELFASVDIILIPLLFYAFKPEIPSRSVVVFIGLNLILIILFYNKLILT